MTYCRLRWNLQIADEFFLNQPLNINPECRDEEQACEFLVRLLFHFATARSEYHSHIECRIKRPLYSQVAAPQSAKELIRTRPGRPKALRLTKDDEKSREDLWIILIWPIALRHHWTYQDVVRAVRLTFGHREPQSSRMPTAEQIVRYFTKPRKQQAQLTEWENYALKVNRSDKNAMKLRCNRLGLPSLNRNKKDICQLPELLDAARRIIY